VEAALWMMASPFLTVIGIKFIGGDPKNWATKAVAGRL
jgi:hypothetical protein